MRLPKVVNAMQVVTYEVEDIVEAIVDDNRCQPSDVTIDMVMEYIESMSQDDFRRGECVTVHFQDENGDEISYGY